MNITTFLEELNAPATMTSLYMFDKDYVAKLLARTPQIGYIRAAEILEGSEITGSEYILLRRAVRTING